ncbi:MAG: hypothetical protein SFZ02_00930 [bacterium]|nr:hypothetical protein [bacterium]
MKRFILFSLILLTLGGVFRPAPTVAQPLNMPLVMLIEGDLWTWNPQTEALVQLTTWGYNFKPVMSPNGDWVAYKSWATITVDAINANAPMNPVEPPGNIWLIDPFTGDAIRIADQPADAVFGTASNDRFVARSNPVWSLDGTEIAWTEFIFPEYASQLVVYNIAAQTTRIAINGLPIGYEQSGPVDVVWGNFGIVYPTTNYNAGTEQFEDTYYVYDPNGGGGFNSFTIADQYEVNHGAFWFTGTEFINGMDNGVAIITGSNLPKLVNPLTGVTNDFMGMLVGYSAWQSLTQGNYVSFSQYNVGSDYGLIWSSQSSDGRFLGDIGTSISYFDTFSKMAISPDGLSVAYIADDGSVLVWQNGLTIQLPVSNVEAVVWSPVLWTTNYPVGG